MADNNPRRPHPGQRYRHGWEPVTPQAAVEKNHGRKVKANSAVARLLKEASESHQRMRQQDADRKAGKTPDMSVPKGAPTKSAAAKAGQPRGPESQRAEDALRAALGRKTATPKPGKQAETPAPTKAPEKPAAKKPAKAPKAAGPTQQEKTAKALDYAKKLPKKPAEDDDDDPGLPAGVTGIDGSGNMLRSGDRVEAMSGDHDGKTGKVLGRNADGSLNVDFGDGPVKVRAGDLKQRPAAKAAPKAPAKPSGDAQKDDKPAPAPSGKSISDGEVEDSIHDALNSLSKGEGKWNTMTALRGALKGIPRDQQDRVLKKMVLSHQIDLVPVAISGNLKPEDHEAALQLPSGPNHQIRVNALAPKRQRTTPVKKAEPAPDPGKRVPDSQVESSVKDALKDYPEGKWSSMTALRKKLSGIPRNQQDDVIRQMMLDGIVDIEPVAIYGDLKQEDRDAEIMIGPKPNHQIRLSRR